MKKKVAKVQISLEKAICILTNLKKVSNKKTGCIYTNTHPVF